MKYLRILLHYIIECALHLFYVFPIRKNRVLFQSFMWKQYSCNPKYISEYLEKNYPNKYELVWAFKKPEDFQYLEQRGIHIVRARSLAYYYYRLTARVSITNTTMAAEVPKRKGQYLINTWHGGGGGYKKIDYSSSATFRPRLEMSRMDLFCASSETSLKNTVRIAFGHDGDYFPGTPRNDMLVNGDRLDIRDEVYKALNLDKSNKVLLYAPTYREGIDSRHSANISEYGLDFEKLHEALEKRFAGRWVIAVRYHQKVSEYQLPECDYVVDATSYPDMQELLASVDAMITDYSSSLWDFSFTNKPCFLFCADLEEYERKRGFNKSIEEWGFPIAQTNEQLGKEIQSWDATVHKKKMDEHHTINGSFEDGTATKRMCEIIEKKCFGKEC